MRLVIREYLSMQKESGELDVLLPDLLLAMGFDILSRPGIGSRQFGVDLPAIGIDPKDNKQKLFLITVKQGDITRNDWDTGKQAVRPSLNEILDSYLRNRVRPEHGTLPKKIILATGGELKQDVEPDWTNYVYKNTGPHQSYGEIEFDFWGGDRLALLIEQYFLDEYLFPESAQKQIRKTIALADQNEDEPRYFYTLVEETLFKRNLPTEKTKRAECKRQKALCLLNLSLNIVFHWCQEADNLRPALFCAERTILCTWDWMRQNDLFDCKITRENFYQLFTTYFKITQTYASKFQPHCFVRDGLFGYGSDELEYPLRTFELIGVLGLLIMTLLQLASIWQANEEMHESFCQEMEAVAQMLTALIKNNPSALTPQYDEHAIDIGIGFLALTAAKYTDDLAKWLHEVSNHVVFAYNKLGRYFPISSDSYNDLVAMQVGQAPPKEQLMELSTLLPMLAEWYAVLDLTAPYSSFQQAVTKTFIKTNLQIWFPDEYTDTYLYSTNAGRASGSTLSSIQLPTTLDDLRTRIISLYKEQQVFLNLSCVAQGFPVLGLIASRHFRTPIIPAYWQGSVREPISSEKSMES